MTTTLTTSARINFLERLGIYAYLFVSAATKDVDLVAMLSVLSLIKKTPIVVTSILF